MYHKDRAQIDVPPLLSMGEFHILNLFTVSRLHTVQRSYTAKKFYIMIPNLAKKLVHLNKLFWSSLILGPVAINTYLV